MSKYLKKYQKNLFYRTSLFLLILSFLNLTLSPAIYAQSFPYLPQPGTMVPVSPGFTPALLKGIKVFPDNPLQFDFFVDRGDSGLEIAQIQQESLKLIKYFLASLTIPEEELWVNLSPYEKGRIIPERFGQTEMGRDLLAQDYLLKQLTASLMYPEDGLGKKFWDRVYKKTNELYGTTDIPINTFNKVWIVPDKATVFEDGDTAFVVESHLKVMLEEDYMSLMHNLNDKQRGTNQLKEEDVRVISNVSSQVVKEVLIPEIEKEINEGRSFANLRQIYNSMILATWFKQNLKQSLLGQVYVDQNKTKGVETDDPQSKQKIYEQYLEAFKKGVYNFIKEDYDTAIQEVITRRYFSGGADWTKFTKEAYRAVKRAQLTQPRGFRDLAMLSDVARSTIMALPEVANEGNLLRVHTLIIERGIGADEEYARTIPLRSPGYVAETPDAAMMASSIEPMVRRTLETRAPRMLGELRAAVGLDKVRDSSLVGNKFASIGFDDKDNRLGWTVAHLEEILSKPETTIEKVLTDAQTIRDKYKYVIFSGMGGSGLSVQAVKTTFGTGVGPEIYSLRTTDPAAVHDILEDIVRREKGSWADILKKALVVVISKSGTTQETKSHQDYFERLYSLERLYTGKKVDPKDHFWLVTDPGSPMEKEAKDKGYQLRYIQLNGKTDIGGRFTAPLTNVFLLPMALTAPRKITTILQKAKTMNDVTDLNQDQFLRLGSYLYHMATDLRKDKVTFLVPEEFRDLPMWAEQLFEESLGKDGKGVTIFYGEDLDLKSLKGVKTNDRVFVRVNVGGKQTQEKFATDLKKKNYPVFDINVDSVDAIGGLMLGFQRAVATIAYLWDINFVNQPGVEAYKRQSRSVMAQLKPGEKVEVPKEWKSVSYIGRLNIYYTPLIEAGIMTEEELRKEVEEGLGSEMSDAAAVYAAIINISRRKEGDPSSQSKFEVAEIASYGKMDPQFRQAMQQARTNIFTRGLKIPSKLGEGPDKNHSYQQNLAQGKDMFFSTYLMPLTTLQPAELAFDENALRAQTIGTVNSLVEAKRKVVLITVSGERVYWGNVVTDFFKEVQDYLKRSPPRDLAMMATVELEELKRTRPTWNWEKALEVPWAEVVRYEKQEVPGAGDTNRQNYYANQKEVRIEVLRLLYDIANGKVADVDTFKERFSRLNRITLTGLDGNRVYMTILSQVAGFSTKDIREGAGRYIRDDETTQKKLESLFTSLREMTQLEVGRVSLEELTDTIAKFYTKFFEEDFVFSFGNNSLAMNIVNATLRLHDFNGISHGMLDVAPAEKVRDLFLVQVRRSNVVDAAMMGEGSREIKQPTILLAEDDERLRLALREVLEAEGYRIVEAGDGNQVLQVLRREVTGIQLIISDVQMPVGWLEMAPWIGREFRSIPVILATGTGEEGLGDDVLRNSAPNVMEVLRKPLDLSFISTVHKVFTQSLGDSAMLAAQPEIASRDQLGGIDLNPALLDLQIKRDDKGIPLPLPMQPIQDMKIEGFLPVIINITPVTSLPILLGVDELQKQEKLEARNPKLETISKL